MFWIYQLQDRDCQCSLKKKKEKKETQIYFVWKKPTLNRKTQIKSKVMEKYMPW